jgi:hypothetical protein
MKEKKFKVIRIQILHDLTPMHEEIMTKAVNLTMIALNQFWSNKSKKDFQISTNYGEMTRNGQFVLKKVPDYLK